MEQFAVILEGAINHTPASSSTCPPPPEMVIWTPATAGTVTSLKMKTSFHPRRHGTPAACVLCGRVYVRKAWLVAHMASAHLLGLHGHTEN